MGVILYRPGTGYERRGIKCEARVFNEKLFKPNLNAGWFMSPEECYPEEPEEIEIPEEVELVTDIDGIFLGEEKDGSVHYKGSEDLTSTLVYEIPQDKVTPESISLIPEPEPEVEFISDVEALEEVPELEVVELVEEVIEEVPEPVKKPAKKRKKRTTKKK